MLPAKRGSKFDHRGKTGHRNFFDIFCHSLTHKYQLCSLQGMTFDSWGSRVVGFTFLIWNKTVSTEVGGYSAQVSSVQCPCKMAQIEMTYLYSTQQDFFQTGTRFLLAEYIEEGIGLKAKGCKSRVGV